MKQSSLCAARCALALLGAGSVSMLAAPAGLPAQIPWESPTVVRPGAPAGVTFLFVDYGLGAFTGVGPAVIIRSTTAPGGFGLRFSAAQGPGECSTFCLDGQRVNLAGGIDMSAWLLRSSAQFPADVIWTSGAGASYGEYLQIAVPIGIAGGRTLSSEDVWFYPYASARAVLEGAVARPTPEEEEDEEGYFSLGLAIDVGADLAFGSSRNLTLHLAVSLGDRHAAAIGLHFGGGGVASSTRANR